MNNSSQRTLKIIIFLFAVAAAVNFWVIEPKKNSHKAIAGIRDPIQKEASGMAKWKEEGNNAYFRLLYSYDIEALVVHTHSYWGNTNAGDRLSPLDLGLAWGKVAEYNDRIDFHWSQSGRWLSWMVNDVAELKPVGGVEGVGKNVSNNHIIPENKTVERQVKRIRTGDHVRLKGYLVAIEGVQDNGSEFWWNSSTDRNDSGDGACEVFYVKEVTKLP